MDDDAGVGIPVDELEQLRSRAERAAQLEDENAALQRDLALQRAGVDTGSESGRIFARGYDGELTPDAIRAQAESFFRATDRNSEVVAQEALARAGEAPPAAAEDPLDLVNAAGSVDEVMSLAAKFNWPTVGNRPA